MKGKKTLAAAWIMFSMVGFMACSKDKDNNSNVNDPVAEDEAAEAMTQTVSGQSGGFATQLSFAAMTAPTLPCNAQQSNIYSGHSPAGATISYNYSLKWIQLLNCANGQASSYQSSFSGHLSYDAPRMSSDDSADAHFMMTGMQLSGMEYTVNASYYRHGMQISKVHQHRSFTSDINIVGSDIKVSKQTHKVISGTATISISGVSSSGRSFSYQGMITFTGNDRATIAVSGGNSYDVTW